MCRLINTSFETKQKILKKTAFNKTHLNRRIRPQVTDLENVRDAIFLFYKTRRNANRKRHRDGVTKVEIFEMLTELYRLPHIFEKRNAAFIKTETVIV